MTSKSVLALLRLVWLLKEIGDGERERSRTSAPRSWFEKEDRRAPLRMGIKVSE